MSCEAETSCPIQLTKPSQSGRPSASAGLATRTRHSALLFQARPSPHRLLSHFFSQSYETNLPTSLTYIALSTRGSSPWRPAADTRYGLARLDTTRKYEPRFSRADGQCFGHRVRRGALRMQHPSLWTSQFQGRQLLTKKRQLFPRLPPTSLGPPALPPSQKRASQPRTRREASQNWRRPGSP